MWHSTGEGNILKEVIAQLEKYHCKQCQKIGERFMVKMYPL